MKIVEIEVSFGLTENLGDYNNCRPEIRLKAEVQDDDNLDDVYISLLTTARAKVQSEADAMLMKHGQAPRYYEGPRYTARSLRNYGAIVIYPSDCYFSHRTYDSIIKHRYPLDRLTDAVNAELKLSKDPATVHHCFTQEQLDTTMQRLQADYEAACAAAEAERAARDTAQTQAEHHIDDDDDDGDDYPF